MAGIRARFGILFVASCFLTMDVNAMSVYLEPANPVANQDHESQYLEKLSELKNELIEKMRTIANILEYIDAYVKTKSKTGPEKMNPNAEVADPYVLSKIDVWLEGGSNAADIPLDVIGSVLDATLHDRFKRSPKDPKKDTKKKRTDNEENDSSDESQSERSEEEADNDEKKDKEKEKRKKGRSGRRSQKRKSKQ